MAAVTHGIGTPNTANVTSYVSDAFTPAANDLIAVLVYATATGAATILSSAGLTFSSIINNSTDTYLFVANELAANVSQTVTIDFAADAATGCIIKVVRISGMTNVGAAAVAQFKTATGSGGATPAATFDALPNAANPIIAYVVNADNTSPVVTPPSGFTERDEQVMSTPGAGAEYASKDSGGPTTVTWGSTVVAAWAAIIVELQPTTARTLAVDSGSFGVTGATASLKYGRKVAALAGSIALSGTAATLKRGSKVVAVAGAFALSGTAAGLKHGSKLTADAGSFSVSGADASLKRGRYLAAASTSLSLSGTAAAVKYGRFLANGAASFALNGSNVTLTYVPVTGRLLFAEAASLSFSGTAVSVKRGRKLAAAIAGYDLTGSLVTLMYGREVSAEAGSFNIFGGDAEMRVRGLFDPPPQAQPRPPGSRFNDRRFNDGGALPLRK